MQGHPRILMNISNTIYSSEKPDYPLDYTYFSNEKTMRERVMRASQGMLSKCIVESYDHPLFDKAYIVQAREFGSDTDYWRFVAYKELDDPFDYYDFRENNTALTDDNLSDYLIKGDILEFSVEFILFDTLIGGSIYPVNRNEISTKSELIKVVDSIIRKEK
jgi:hypothetical protein